jgi:rhodanese-related sulfurtransferase
VTRRTLDDLLREARATIERYAPADAWQAAGDGALIVDTRVDRAAGIVPGSLHIPLSVLQWRLDPDSAWRNPHLGGLETHLILICDHGESSSLAAASLRELGFARVGDVVGGFEAWADAGLPVAAAPPAPDGLPGLAGPAS